MIRNLAPVARWPVLGLLCLLLAAPALADYRDSYREGMQALDRKNWSGVLDGMGRAARERGTESTEKINLYGMRFEPYLPHFYLGLAHFNLGNYDSAEAEWKISQQQGAIQSTPQNKELQRLLPELENKKKTLGRALAEAVQAANRELASAGEAESLVARLRQQGETKTAFEADATLTRDQQQATGTLGSARTALEQGQAQKSLDKVGEATKLARQARTELEGLAQRARQRGQEIQTEIARRESAALEDALQDAQQEIDRAARLDTDLTSRRAEEVPGRIFREDASLNKTQTEARALLESARRALGEGRQQKDPAKAAAAGESARRARTQLDELTKKVDARTQTILDQMGQDEATALAAAIAKAETEIGQTNRTADDLEALRRDANVAQAFSTDRALERDRTSALQSLEEARRTLQTARDQRQRDRADRAAELARQARSQLETITGRAGQRADEIRAEEARRADALRLEEERRAEEARRARIETERRQTLQNQIRTLRGEARDLASRAQARQSPSPALTRNRAILDRLGGNAPGDNASSAELETYRDQLAGALGVTRELLSQADQAPDKPRPPAELVAAARAYFEGNYRQSLSALEGAQFPDPRAQVQAHVFRAAAQFALYRASGGDDDALLEAVRKEIAACRKLDGSFQPDASAFAPHFVTLFRQGP